MINTEYFPKDDCKETTTPCAVANPGVFEPFSANSCEGDQKNSPPPPPPPPPQSSSSSSALRTDSSIGATQQRPMTLELFMNEGESDWHIEMDSSRLRFETPAHVVQDLKTFLQHLPKDGWKTRSSAEESESEKWRIVQRMKTSALMRLRHNIRARWWKDCPYMEFLCYPSTVDLRDPEKTAAIVFEPKIQLQFGFIQSPHPSDPPTMEEWTNKLVPQIQKALDDPSLKVVLRFHGKVALHLFNFRVQKKLIQVQELKQQVVSAIQKVDNDPELQQASQLQDVSLGPMIQNKLKSASFKAALFKDRPQSANDLFEVRAQTELFHTLFSVPSSEGKRE